MTYNIGVDDDKRGRDWQKDSREKIAAKKVKKVEKQTSQRSSQRQADIVLSLRRKLREDRGGHCEGRRRISIVNHNELWDMTKEIYMLRKASHQYT